MKKTALSLILMGIISLSSCKNEKSRAVDSTENAIENMHQVANEILEEESNLEEAAKIATDIPQFSNEENQKFAQDYAQYFNEIMEASAKNDSEKLHLLMSEGVEWSKKAQDQMNKMTAEDKQKWTQWSSKLRSAAAGE